MNYIEEILLPSLMLVKYLLRIIRGSLQLIQWWQAENYPILALKQEERGLTPLNIVIFFTYLKCVKLLFIPIYICSIRLDKNTPWHVACATRLGLGALHNQTYMCHMIAQFQHRARSYDRLDQVKRDSCLGVPHSQVCMCHTLGRCGHPVRSHVSQRVIVADTSICQYSA